MGYTTEFEGQIDLDPPLNASEILAIQTFSNERHDETPEDREVMPGAWCHWIAQVDGDALEWDGGEKFYHAAEWMQLVLDRFITPLGISANGTIEAQGEEAGDLWRIVVKDNVVRTIYPKIVWDEYDEEDM